MVPEDVFDDSSSSEPDGNTVSPDSQQGGNEPEGKGRSLENLRGELLRKNDRLEQQIAAISQNMQNMAKFLETNMAKPEEPKQPPRNVPQNPVGAPVPRIEEYTDEQLNQALASGQLNVGQRQYIERTLQNRAVERKTQQLFEARDLQQKIQTARETARKAALDSFPALRDENSEFAREVKAALDQQRAQFGDHPMDEFDVANRIARQRGIDASRVTVPGYVGRPGSGEPTPQEPDEPQGQSEEQIREIAGSLRYALPLRFNPETGRMERKKFNLKRIKERSKRYEENSQFYNQRKMRGGS